MRGTASAICSPFTPNNTSKEKQGFALWEILESIPDSFSNKQTLWDLPTLSMEKWHVCQHAVYYHLKVEWSAGVFFFFSSGAISKNTSRTRHQKCTWLEKLRSCVFLMYSAIIFLSTQVDLIKAIVKFSPLTQPDMVLYTKFIFVELSTIS